MSKESKIKTLRLRAGLSQNGLARKANLDRATVAAAEAFKHISDVSLARIATALAVDSGEIDERI
ncbi:MAG: helix-turn-helix transcriptional regulator [Hyphomicrobium sp.]